jgi:hypothetical protein
VPQGSAFQKSLTASLVAVLDCMGSMKSVETV